LGREDRREVGSMVGVVEVVQVGVVSSNVNREIGNGIE
jgi:hypothetical protein